jgi:hypothetical protein
MRRAALALALIILPGCAGFQEGGLKAMDAAVCVIEDETLSVAFKDPERAREYLTDLAKRLEGPETTTVVVDGMEVPLPVSVPSDREAVDEAIGLIKKLMECVPK